MHFIRVIGYSIGGSDEAPNKEGASLISFKVDSMSC